MTKEYFRKILNETLFQAKNEYDSDTDLDLHERIWLQLIDIKRQVVEQGVHYSEDEANGKYSLGILAIRNFDEENDNDYSKKLSDIAWGISLYQSIA